MNDSPLQELINIEQSWTAAIANNDVVEISKFMADDWVLIEAGGRIVDRERFLSVIRSGDLVHHSMTSDDYRVRVYGDSGVLTCVTRSKGSWQEHEFEFHERATSVCVKRNGKWLGVLTQLTAIK